MTREKTLYWIGTPRHFLIAAGMAVGDSDFCDSHLLLTSRFDYVDGIRTVLDRWQESPFSHVRVIRPRGRVPGRIKSVNRIRSARNLEKFRRMARESAHEYSELRVFTATDTVTQAFLYETKRFSPTTKRIMVEDGGIYYNSQNISDDSADKSFLKWKGAAGRILYGRSWSAVKKNGIGEVIDEIQMIAPHLARKELASVNRVKLSPDHMLRLADTELPNLYFALFDCNSNEMANIETLIILSRSDSISDDPTGYVETVNALANTTMKRGLKTAIKYHPKEPLPDYMGLKDRSDAIEIPREIPMELLFIVNSRSLKLILGDASSALLSAPWMLPDCKAVSFVNMVNKAPELIYDNFEGFGIESIDSFNDLERILEAA